MSTVSPSSAKKTVNICNARVHSGTKAKRIAISASFVPNSPKLCKAITWAAHMGSA